MYRRCGFFDERRTKIGRKCGPREYFRGQLSSSGLPLAQSSHVRILWPLMLSDGNVQTSSGGQASLVFRRDERRCRPPKQTRTKRVAPREVASLTPRNLPYEPQEKSGSLKRKKKPAERSGRNGFPKDAYSSRRLFEFSTFSVSCKLHPGVLRSVTMCLASESGHRCIFGRQFVGPITALSAGSSFRRMRPSQPPQRAQARPTAPIRDWTRLLVQARHLRSLKRGVGHQAGVGQNKRLDRL